MIDYNYIEIKWQKAWDEAKIFEPEVNDKKQFMVTAAIPYPNGPQHIGHLRTYGTADSLARYKRMQGFNVLYPMGFHLTGIPLFAQAKKVKEKNPGILEDFKSFNISEEDIQKMSDPLYMGLYFTKEVEEGMKLAGFSIDWRKKFLTVDKNFSKFIEWQFGILKENGFLVQGAHPVGWCTNENNPVGMHDTKGDVEPEIEEETSILFKIDGEEFSLMCSTYRPETIYGVTNIFANSSVIYAKCKLNGFGDVILSNSTYEKLKFQLKLEKTGEILGSELIGKNCINPFSNNKIPIFSGFFVKETVGTGLVMSVPAHAPFDYVALEKLKASGVIKSDIKPIIVLSIDGIEKDEIPALHYLKRVKADINSDEGKIEEATKLEYKEESHKGRMNFPGYINLPEPEVREKIKKYLEGIKASLSIYILANKEKVLCRCGTEIIVKLIENQWFINYGDENWKNISKEALNATKIIPIKSRNAFDAAVDWINLRAVARSQGLGTKFPLDNKYIIESLSDSTIYMAIYTIYDIIKSIDESKLKPSFFDYVFRNKGDIDFVSKDTGIDFQTIKRSKESFEYWYINTSRHSGLDLIFNHLTMYIFNHAAVFDKKYWPKQIVVNGLVMMNGEKMSKSLGNIILLKEGIKKYGADILRLLEIGNTDLFNDSNFVEDSAKGLKDRIEYIYNSCLKINELPSNKLVQIDYWLYSKLNRKISLITEAMETLEMRDIVTNIIFNTNIELKKYFSRGGNNGVVLKEYLSTVSLMLQPIAPHLSEELWHVLGNTTLSATERWPLVDNNMIDENVELKEKEIDELVEDIRQISNLTKKKISNLTLAKIIVASQWKRDLLNLFIENKNIQTTLSSLKEGVNKETAAKYLTKLLKQVNTLKKVSISTDEEVNAIAESIPYLASLTGLKIEVELEDTSKLERAERALPLKPSISLS